jgi:diguanylate cyclase (GGDEF)-like protein
LFHDRLDQAISESHRRESKFALLFIDLDRFKIVNDTSGHHVGDLLLKEVASRLTSTVRESDTVARLGGDEFVIILQEIEHATDVSKVAAKIIDKLNQPFLIEGHELHTPPSIGISMYPIDATDSEGLILAADTAMYHVKEHGKNDYQYFTYAMTEVAHARAQLEQELRVALEQKQFELHFQPKISLEPERVSGCEVLLRWKHPQRGYIPPDQFIPIAEEAGVILAIGEWILDETAKQVSIWRDQGLHDLTVAINLSPVQFRDESLSSKIEECVQRSTLAAHKVELEITENIFMDTIEDSVDGLTLMKSLGVCLAIDDFGTGYSSLSYLKRFDVNTLKIDKSFVSDIDTKPDGAAIVAAIISLAHNLGLTVVAEGVETKAQLDYLHSLTCDEFQGYYFSKPLPADAFYDFVMAFNKDLCENSEK